jgi:hypothetical protein
MRALGRPNREQIVTVRPADLTRLQALELFNSQLLTDMLAQGAESLLARHAKLQPNELITQVYRGALSRPPSNDELSTARKLLGETPAVEGMQDLLWAVIMLPEFQLIR